MPPTALQPADGVPPPSERVLALHLPLDRYIPSVDEIYTVEAATDRLVRRCMAERGLSWPLVGHPVFGDWRNRRRYGVIETLVAHHYGFHAVPALLGPVQVYNDKVRRTNALTYRQRSALTDPKTGCEPMAYAQLRRGISQPDYSLANHLGGQSLYAAEKQPDVRVALDQWSHCMLAAGYHYADPLAASADERWSKSDKATPLEVTTAETAVRCDDQVNLVTTWSDADATIQRGMITQNADYFAAMATSKSELLSAATKVINAAP